MGFCPLSLKITDDSLPTRQTVLLVGARMWEDSPQAGMSQNQPPPSLLPISLEGIGPNVLTLRRVLQTSVVSRPSGWCPGRSLWL